MLLSKLWYSQSDDELEVAAEAFKLLVAPSTKKPNKKGNSTKGKKKAPVQSSNMQRPAVGTPIRQRYATVGWCTGKVTDVKGKKSRVEFEDGTSEYLVSARHFSPVITS